MRRALGPWQAASLVVGTIIGTGVFLKTAVMAQLGSPLWVLAAWAAAGVLSLAGALTYAELGSMFPEAGGEYVYLRESYGRFAGFSYAWMRFWIGSPGSIAAYAVGAATFASSAFDVDALAVGPVGGRTVIALGVIAMFAALNSLHVGAGGRAQTALTALKVAIIVLLAGGALVAPRGDWAHLSEGEQAFPGGVPFSAMVLAALWAFDGWSNLPMAAGEVRDPTRNVPRALVLGALAVLGIYAVVNLGYFHALPLAEIQASASPAHPHAPAVAARVAEQFVGGTTQIVIACAMMLSALSAMNGSMLTGARVPYAAARDGLAPAALARLPAGARVPRTAIVVQACWAGVLALSGRFDDLTDAVVFALWMFYALNAGAVILLRRRAPETPRPFRVPGYPVTPIVFIALAVVLLASTLIAKPMISGFGAGVMGIGAIVYAVLLRRGARGWK